MSDELLDLCHPDVILFNGPATNPPLTGNGYHLARALTGLLGYRHGPPPGMGEDALAIDRDLAGSLPCPECGGACAYHALHRPALPGLAPSYKALACCKRCGHATEF
jgi:hypothetical protein